MPVFLIERTFAEQLQEDVNVAAKLREINAEAGVEWLISFLSADKKKTYCLYVAADEEAIREAAHKAGIPVDAIIEVGELRNTGQIGEVLQERFS
jgi:hypothetical protein